MADEFGQILQQFLSATHRTLLSPAEYGAAIAEGWDRMPPQVLSRLLMDALEQTPAARRSRARLTWYLHDVRDGYAAWRRAIGPQG